MSKKEKLYAVVFPKSKDIYDTLSNNNLTLGQKAIFSDRKGAERWIKMYSKEEIYKPKIIQINL